MNSKIDISSSTNSSRIVQRNKFITTAWGGEKSITLAQFSHKILLLSCCLLMQRLKKIHFVGNLIFEMFEFEETLSHLL